MNLKESINQNESEILEFKESLQLKDEIGQTISAFSNSKGGNIVIGISDQKEIKGIQIGKETIRDLSEYIKRNTDPQIFPQIEIQEFDKKKIISITIKESKEKPVFFKNYTHKRVGDTNQRTSSSEIRKLAREIKERIYWDGQICGEASLEDVDEEKVRWFIREAKKQRGLNISETNFAEEILMKLKLVKNKKITNAALLIFPKTPKFLQSEIKCIRFSGNEPIKPYIDFQAIEGSILELIEKAEDFILRNIKKSIWVVPEKLQREEKYEYPPGAIREAIVNAVVHRDYESSSKVQVRVFDDYIEIWNPGSLPEGWTAERLKQKHESIPKNPLLFKQLFWIKYVEDVGGGTIDMIEECKKWGIPEPDFEDTGTAIVVIFKKFSFTPEILKTLKLNERQIKTLEFIKEHNRISTKEYCNLFNVARDTANRDLNDLLEKGIIERQGHGPRTYYILSAVSIGQYRTVSDSNSGKKEKTREIG